MQCENTTPTAAYVHVANPDDTDRVMTVSVKATFFVNDDGRVELDRKDPLPIEIADRETDFGVFPQDIMPTKGSVFEVFCLGQAHAPGQNPVQQMDVEMTVGETSQRLRVSGDRHWTSIEEDPRISEPEPFSTMPILWENAFGGTSEVWIDRESAVDIRHPLNPFGKGFDPRPQAGELKIGLPEGYPIFPTELPLPNIESPDELVTAPLDQPMPRCFAPIPLMSPLHMKQFVEFPNSLDEGEILPQVDRNRVNSRAASEWRLPIPNARTRVSLLGMTSDGELSFELPEVRFLIDYIFGEKEGTTELIPQRLMLLPEERRFYLLFKDFFSFSFIEEMERCIRVRMEEGWYTTNQGGLS